MLVMNQVKIEPKDVINTYSGKDGCACGCAGSYNDEPESMSSIKRINKVNEKMHEVTIFSGYDSEYIFELTTKQPDDYQDGRVIRIYVDGERLLPVTRAILDTLVVK